MKPGTGALRQFPALLLAFFSAMLILLGLVATVLNAPLQDWNEVRLSSTAAMLSGLNIYAPDAPLLPAYKPPLAFLAYYPAVWAAEVDAQIRVASLLSILWIVVPACLITAGFCRHNRGAVVLLVLVLMTGPLMMGIAGLVHADAPMLGAAMIAIALLCRALERRGVALLGLAAVVAVAAMLAKLTAVVLFPAFCVICGMQRGWRWAGGAALAMLGAMLLGSLWLESQFGLWTVWLNSALVSVPHYANPQWPDAKTALSICWLCALLVLVQLLRQRVPADDRPDRHRPGTFLIAGLCFGFAGIAGILKPGGASNHLAAASAFFIVAACLHIADFRSAFRPAWKYSTTLIAMILLLGFLLTLHVQARNLWSLRHYHARLEPLQELDRILAHDCAVLTPTRPMRYQRSCGEWRPTIGAILDRFFFAETKGSPDITHAAVTLLVPDTAIAATEVCRIVAFAADRPLYCATDAMPGAFNLRQYPIPMH